MIRRFLGGEKTSEGALTNLSKPDIMKFRGVLCDDEQPREGYGEKEEMLYLHASLYGSSDRRVQPGGTTGTPPRLCGL